MELRLATPADAEAIAQMVLKAWAGKVAANSSGHFETPEKVLADLSNGRGFMIEQEGQIVASVRWVHHPLEAGVCEIHKLGVLPEFRKHGLGQKLLETLEADAKAHGIKQVRLAVRSDQYRLVEWYREQGYALDKNLIYSHANPKTLPPFVLKKDLEVEL